MDYYYYYYYWGHIECSYKEKIPRIHIPFQPSFTVFRVTDRLIYIKKHVFTQ